MEKSINQLCSIISGGTPKTSIDNYWNGNIPWISIKDFISVNRYILTTEKSITEQGLANSATNLLKENDIIISSRGTVGEVALIKEAMAFNQSCYGIRTNNNDELRQNYLFYWLKAHKVDIQTGTHGAVFDTITRDDFSRLKIDVPNISFQDHIVNTISSLLLKSF